MGEWELLLLALAGGTLGGWLGMLGAHDYLELKKHMAAMRGDSRHETLRKLRAQVEVMRQEYLTTPGDRFACDLWELLNKLEDTLARVEQQEFVAVGER